MRVKNAAGEITNRNWKSIEVTRRKKVMDTGCGYPLCVEDGTTMITVGFGKRSQEEVEQKPLVATACRNHFVYMMKILVDDLEQEVPY